ncbi:MAG TPA: hypothetical protein ENN46_02140 [Candidatus Woesearchaeota archaeon]|nr:hypothetical protein [Candidatus Woesearchaeota archaeon]
MEKKKPSKKDAITESAEKKLEGIKKILEEFKEKSLDKFSDYILGISLLPPSKDKDDKIDPNKINVLMLMDDSDTKKMSKQELKEKLTKIIEEIAKKADDKLSPAVVLLSELWQNCYDSKYEFSKMIASGAQIYDKGILAAIKVTEVHKQMVLEKFERYIVSYVLAGSLTQGKATEKSDIDVFIVVDDTDVKKMTRGELKEKLRAIIIGMGAEAGEMTGVINKLNIQVYILTEFWESLRDANPVIFTLLRHGVPLYDRGVFMPWKQLLVMGKIKPSQEAIDLFMSTGERILEKVTEKLNEIGIEDIFYALLTPSQATLMHYGIPPPTPRETPELMKEIFADKEKLIEAKDLEILKKVIKARKEVEHKVRTSLSGKEIDEMIKEGKEYLKKVDKLFKDITKMKDKETAHEISDSLKTTVRKVLETEGVSKTDESQLIKRFRETLINTGKIPDRILKKLESAIEMQKQKTITKQDLDKHRKNAAEIIGFLKEYLERSRFYEIERGKVKVIYGENKIAEVINTDKGYILIKDLKEKAYKLLDKKKLSEKAIEQDDAESLLRDEKTKIVHEMPVSLIDKIKELFGKDCKIITT